VYIMATPLEVNRTEVGCRWVNALNVLVVSDHGYSSMTSTTPHRLPSCLICQPAIVSASFGKAAGRRTRSTPPLSIAMSAISQVPVQPEAVPACLVATEHPSRGRHAEMLLRLRHRAGELRQVLRRHRHLAPPHAVAKREPPTLVAQLQRHVQHRRRCVIFVPKGHWVSLWVSFFG